jgi:hypothetical protein
LRADNTLKPVQSTLPRQHLRSTDAARPLFWNSIPAPRKSAGASAV